MIDRNKTRLTVVRRELNNFAAIAFKPADVVEVRVLPAAQSRWTTAAELPDLADWLLAVNERRQNIYIGGCPRVAYGKRGNANVPLARCMFTDHDHMTPDEARERIESAGLPEPTLMTFTGGGVQSYWRLVGACTDMDLWEELIRDIIAAAGSDPACCNPERLLRAPGGFFNWKYDPAPQTSIIDISRTAFAFDHLRGIVPRKQEEERHQRERQATARKAKLNQRGAQSGESVIDAFNAAHDIDAMLLTYGYTRGTKGRYIRPGGKSESVSVKDGRSCHHSSSDRMHDYKPVGCPCGVADPFDMYRVHEHGGDFSRAVKAAAEAMGITRAATITTSSSGEFVLVSHGRKVGAA